MFWSRIACGPWRVAFGHAGAKSGQTEFACMRRVQVAKCENHENCWTFCSFVRGEKNFFNILKCNFPDAFGLGSKHRAVFHTNS